MPPYHIASKLWEDASRKLAAIAKPPPGVITHFTLPARYAVESLHYLADIDDARFGGAWVQDGHANAAIDISHVRCAAATAATALDLCAATLGRVFGLRTRHLELTVRDFDPRPRTFRTGLPRPNQAAVQAHSALPSDWQNWVNAVLADTRYDELIKARNALVHSDAPRIVHMSTVPENGHAQRCELRFGMVDASAAAISRAPAVKARTVVVDARDLATLHVDSFLRLAAK